MSTKAAIQIATDHRIYLGLRACLLMFMVCTIAGAQDSQTANGAVSDAQREQIQAAQGPEALVDLAKRFVLLREHEAAQICIAKACEADPALLTDDKRPSPSSWREFWFSSRAVLREQALAPKDAAGRVEIATWLHKAGVTGPARELLKVALEIDGTLPEAQKLAKEWYLFGGGPFRFDLTYALNNPLILEDFSDEGTTVEPRRGKKLMLLPFAYETTADKLRITKSSVKVTSDDDRSCRILGIVLLEAPDTHQGGAWTGGFATQTGSLRLQASSEPVWERLEITQTEDGTIELICWNTTPSPGKREALRQSDRGNFFGRQRGSRSSSRGDSFGSSRGEVGAATGRTDDRRQTRPASGYAAFVVQVPESMQSIEAIYRNQITIKLENELLTVLGRPDAEIAPEDQEELVQVLADKVAGSEPVIASAAVGKLASLRGSVGGGFRGFPQAAQGTEIASGLGGFIDRTLMAALMHTDDQVRREAFDALVNAVAPLSESCLAAINNQQDAALAQNLLEQIEHTLSRSVPPGDDSRPTHQRLQQPVGWNRDQTTMLGTADLPVSPASEKVFTILQACLNSGHTKVREKAVDIALKDGSQQSAATLVDIPQDTRAVLIDRFAGLADDPLKAVLLRILLAGADEADQRGMAKLLGACDKLEMTLTGNNDPVLKMIRSRPPAAVQVKLLGLLGRADLSEPSAARALNDLLNALVTDEPLDANMRSALLALAMGQFQLPYHAPVPRTSMSQQLPNRMVISGGELTFEPQTDRMYSQQRMDESQTFESLLARLTTAPGADVQTIRAASGALIRAGRISELDNQFTQMSADGDRARLIRTISQDKELWTREALPMFLAGRLTEGDPKCAQAALAALADIYQATDAKQQWQLNAALKLSINLNELTKLTAAGDDKLARSAISLLRQLGKLSNAESDQLQSAADPVGRQQILDQLSRQRADKPAGKFACMLYLDVKPTGVTQGHRPPITDEQKKEKASPSRDQVKPPKRLVYSLTNIPLVSSNVLIAQDEKRGTRISVAGRNIMDQDGTTPSTGSMRINAALLLSNALKTASKQKHPVADFVDALALGESLVCDLRHKQLGTWTGEVRMDELSGGRSQEGPLQISGAMIVLEPATP